MDAAWAKVLTDWLQYAFTGAAGAVLALWATLGRRDTALSRALNDLRDRTENSLVRHGERLGTLEATATHIQPDRCTGHMSRVVALEQRVEMLPNHGDMGRIHQRIDTLADSLGTIQGSLSRIERTTDMLHQHMLEHGPRARSEQ